MQPGFTTALKPRWRLSDEECHAKWSPPPLVVRVSGHLEDQDLTNSLHVHVMLMTHGHITGSLERQWYLLLS